MFIVYLEAPVHPITDSYYSLLLSHSLVFDRSFALNRYFDFPFDSTTYPGTRIQTGLPYQLIRVHDELYYGFPIGSSILSAPLIALARPFNLSPVGLDGRYDRVGEERLDALIASALMAFWSWLVYETARFWLPGRLALVLALVAGLGTQAMSTTSRALGSDTWAIVILQATLLMVLRRQRSRQSPRPLVLATTLSWLYFVRPTHGISIVAVMVLLLVLRRRRVLFTTALVGGVWLLAFAAFSHHYYLSNLPPYYQAARLSFSAFGTALLGNLVSPARGLLVYVPAILFIAVALPLGWSRVKSKSLVVIGAGTTIVYLAITSGLPHWWGGHSYGPRLMSGVLPWLVILGAQGLQTSVAVAATERHSRWCAYVLLGFATATAGASILINVGGAVSLEAWRWNYVPVDVDQAPERLWDWRDPQFLAGLKGRPG